MPSTSVASSLGMETAKEGQSKSCFCLCVGVLSSHSEGVQLSRAVGRVVVPGWVGGTTVCVS